MPRNGSGVFSRVAGSTAIPQTTIESAVFNAVVDDFVADANTPRPVVAGGTGQNTLAGLRQVAGDFATRAAFVTWVSTNTPVAGSRYTAAGIEYVGSSGATAIADLPGLIPANGDLECFGTLTGTNLTTDMAIWNAAIAWSSASRRVVYAPGGKSSRIEALNWKSYAKVIGYGHTLRVSGTGGVIQTAGTQCYDVRLEGFTWVPHAVGNVGAQPIKWTCLQKSYMGHMFFSGFTGARPWSIESETVTTFDVTVDPWSNSNSIFNVFEDLVSDVSNNGLYIAGKYSTTTTSGIPSSSPDPAAVVTKNIYFGVKYWNCGGVGFHMAKCTDSEHFYDCDVRAAGNITVVKIGNGDADTYVGNNYSNSHVFFGLTYAAGVGTTAMTEIYGASWSIGNRVFAEHDVNFISGVTLTKIGALAGVTRFQPETDGKGADVSLTNVMLILESASRHFRIADGTAVDPSYSFAGETGMGLFRETSGRMGLAFAGVRRFLIEAGRMSFPSGTALLPSITFTDDPQVNTGLFLKADNSVGAAADGVERFGWNSNGVTISGLGNYANDAAAAAGGVPVGHLYRNGSVIQIRVV